MKSLYSHTWYIHMHRTAQNVNYKWLYYHNYCGTRRVIEVFTELSVCLQYFDCMPMFAMVGWRAEELSLPHF